MKLLIIGANGAVGRRAVEFARAQGHSVRAAERSWDQMHAEDPELERVTANVLEDGLAEVCDGVDAVISALGIGLSAQTAIDPPPLYTEGAVRMIEGMRAARVTRLVVISATFVATPDRGSPFFRAASTLALQRIFTQMGEMERILRVASDIEWTAVRPGWLLDLPFSNDYTVTDGAIPEDMIRTRQSDLAHFLVACATGRDWIRGTPAIARHEAPEHSGVSALLREFG